MGQAEFFPQWYEYLSNPSPSKVKVTFLYGSYDIPVANNETQRCHEARLTQDFVDCQVRFLAFSTWTRGRTLLAKEAILLERKQGRKFDVWTFADDDANLHCLLQDDKDGVPRQCWQRFLEILGQARELSSKVTTISPAYGKDGNVTGWAGISTQDAMVNAFRRDYVPFVLPYAVPPPGRSEWISQAVLFCIMVTCFPSSVISPPHFSTENPLHRPYPKRDFTNVTIMRTIRNNYGALVNFDHCSSISYEQGQNRVGPFDSVQELVANIPSQNQTLCAPLLRRFADWEQRIITE